MSENTTKFLCDSQFAHGCCTVSTESGLGKLIQSLGSLSWTLVCTSWVSQRVSDNLWRSEGTVVLDLAAWFKTSGVHNVSIIITSSQNPQNSRVEDCDVIFEGEANLDYIEGLKLKVRGRIQIDHISQKANIEFKSTQSQNFRVQDVQLFHSATQIFGQEATINQDQTTLTYSFDSICKMVSSVAIRLQIIKISSEIKISEPVVILDQEQQLHNGNQILGSLQSRPSKVKLIISDIPSPELEVIVTLDCTNRQVQLSVDSSKDQEHERLAEKFINRSLVIFVEGGHHIKIMPGVLKIQISFFDQTLSILKCNLGMQLMDANLLLEASIIDQILQGSCLSSNLSLGQFLPEKKISEEMRGQRVNQVDVELQPDKTSLTGIISQMRFEHLILQNVCLYIQNYTMDRFHRAKITDAQVKLSINEDEVLILESKGYYRLRGQCLSMEFKYFLELLPDRIQSAMRMIRPVPTILSLDLTLNMLTKNIDLYVNMALVQKADMDRKREEVNQLQDQILSSLGAPTAELRECFRRVTKEYHDFVSGALNVNFMCKYSHNFGRDILTIESDTTNLTTVLGLSGFEVRKQGSQLIFKL